ncbi:hypothetical protein I4U23_005305 [Adineta vaga]|nr:hypothetical protein I4U23_005305 [Adineta vaga]
MRSAGARGSEEGVGAVEQVAGVSKRSEGAHDGAVNLLQAPRRRPGTLEAQREQKLHHIQKRAILNAFYLHTYTPTS